MNKSSIPQKRALARAKREKAFKIIFAIKAVKNLTDQEIADFTGIPIRTLRWYYNKRGVLK